MLASQSFLVPFHCRLVEKGKRLDKRTALSDTRDGFVCPARFYNQDMTSCK